MPLENECSTKNIALIGKENIHNNRLQGINQYAVETEAGVNHNNRYDVTILVNGLPLIHVELKRRSVAIREAFNQIKRYQRDRFWAGSGLFEYGQIFVISHGTHTRYYFRTAFDVSLQKGAMCACGDRIVPAVNSSGIQIQSCTLGVFLRVADPIVDAERRFSRFTGCWRRRLHSTLPSRTAESKLRYGNQDKSTGGRTLCGKRNGYYALSAATRQGLGCVKIPS